MENESEKEEIKRQIDGHYVRCSARTAMEKRALAPQEKADVPPSEPGDNFNLVNPEPGFVIYRKDGKVRKRAK